MAEKQFNSSTDDEIVTSSLYTDHLLECSYDFIGKQDSDLGKETNLELQRSSNEAIIFLYGPSGAGKSASLNHVFGFEVIDSNEERSGSNLVTQYVATVESKELGAANLKIGFIDVPGWGNEGGEEKDILNIATISQFTNNKLFLDRKHYISFPNIVLITINANDRRIIGANSQLVQMFRALTKLNVIDKRSPNLLIILTHVMDLGGKRFLERLNGMSSVVKELAIQYLCVEPVIVYIENHSEDHDLEKMGDFTILRDGTLQPKNVFEAMLKLTEQLGDKVGYEAIRLYFASRATNKPIIEQQSIPGTVNQFEIRKWRSIIAHEFEIIPSNELSEVLQTFAHANADVYSEKSLVSLMIELNTRSVTELHTIQAMTLTQVQDMLVPYMLSPMEIKAVVEGCGIKGYDINQVLLDIGRGVNAVTGVVSGVPVLNETSDCHVQWGVNLPASMHITLPVQNRRIEWNRLDKIVSSPGCSRLEIERKSALVEYQFKIIHSIYTLKMTSSNDQQLLSQLSPAFKEAVRRLPEISIGEENQLRGEYVDFFDIFGHCVILGYECGGYVRGVVTMEERESEQSQMHSDLYIQNFLDQLESDYLANNTFRNSTSEKSQMYKQISAASLSWRGGDCPGQFITLNSLTPWMWLRWINSLQKYPIPVGNPSLCKEQILPIYKLVSLLDSSKCDEIQKLFEIQAIELNQIHLSRYLGDELTKFSTRSKSPHCLRAAVTAQNEPESVQVGFPENSLCIRGSFDDFAEVRIQDILENDNILVLRDPSWIHFDRAGNVIKNDAKLYTYLRLSHEYGCITLGFNQGVLIIFPDPKTPEFILAKDVKLGDMLCYIDIDKRRTLISRVVSICIVVGKGNFSFQKERFGMVAVNRIVIGGEPASCFPGNASVELRGGKRVRMDELKIGDFVLSVNPATGKPVYSRVYLWAHRDPHITATFLHITHPYGHLHISANHLILSGDRMRPVPARQLRIGDTIHFISSCQQQQQQQQQQQPLNGEEKREILTSIPILDIYTCNQNGYYAPFTNNGFLVVDGVTASVYSQVSTHSQSYGGNSWHNVTHGLIQQFGMHRVGHAVLTPMRMIHHTLGIGKLLDQQMDTETHINKYCKLLLHTTLY